MYHVYRVCKIPQQTTQYLYHHHDQSEVKIQIYITKSTDRFTNNKVVTKEMNY